MRNLLQDTKSSGTRQSKKLIICGDLFDRGPQPKELEKFILKLLENDEFAEEAVRAAVERAALKELINNERVYAENGISMAALDEDEDTEE